jgi:hypothetical protein
MAGSIGFLGRYTADGNGEFSGTAWRAQHSRTVRTQQDLRLTATGDQMAEDFRSPGGDGNSHRLSSHQIGSTD